MYLLVHFLWRLHIWQIMHTKNAMFLSHFLLFSFWNNRRKRTDWTIKTSIQFIFGVWTCHYRNFPLDCREQRFCDSFLISFKLFVSFNVKGNMLEHLPEMKEKKRKTTEINDCSAWMILAIVFFSKSVLKWYDILMLDWAATSNNAHSNNQQQCSFIDIINMLFFLPPPPCRSMSVSMYVFMFVCVCTSYCCLFTFFEQLFLPTALMTNCLHNERWMTSCVE